MSHLIIIHMVAVRLYISILLLFVYSNSSIICWISVFLLFFIYLRLNVCRPIKSWFSVHCKISMLIQLLAARSGYCQSQDGITRLRHTDAQVA